MGCMPDRLSGPAFQSDTDRGSSIADSAPPAANCAGLPAESDIVHCTTTSCYFWFAATTWAAAKSKCANMNATMFSPNSQAEHLEVESYFAGTKSLSTYWLGIEKAGAR